MAAKQSAEHSHFPWKHIVGFVLSIVLTLLALWVIYTDLSMAAKLWIIFGFAIIQAGLQLLMFMHMTESDSGKIQVGNTLFAAFIAAAIVIGSIWIFAAHSNHGDNPEGGSPGAKHSEHSGHE
ncbi:quinol oxidase subunit 4 [Bacillus glycinifermentans]|uniref:Quinol oxidase subunit 4 n=1 Tax=Bacillus glycinifermentans TaxID=1664069 RepID=A0A0J6F0C6_9BACI|nr:cytochrome aa3 quinol oxidase subunit IV [Bacillus glycinifermentans]ATH93657.1 cytochrome aa3 quinol oxidase subunit IV [Bacillus glycinifermentans]KMM59203.1 quinol oxidase subunit 4 [Bacillus glycinifermentans]KRT90168.1 quinol oxidase subunit 4 [Bacillus glycinifermentans]MEC0483853.1 cytochrome aa3 quinol oxidase subunit IV [Bacillus glycinifermentans]MEC0496348.1 cytochrome aa3 quinol oxidase subunit IV [Bacillus glycinifermentans]